MIETTVRHGYVIRLLSLASNGIPYDEDHYVRSGDPDYLPEGVPLTDKCGRLSTTWDLRRAKIFASASDAADWMATQSTLMPLRLDGKPNRPFTAYNAEFVPVVLEPTTAISEER